LKTLIIFLYSQNKYFINKRTLEKEIRKNKKWKMKENKKYPYKNKSIRDKPKQ